MLTSDFFFYLIAFLIAVLCLGIAGYAFQHRSVPGATSLAIIMLSSMGYAVPYTLQLLSHNLAAALFLYNLSLPGANLLGPAWLGFALTWTRQDNSASQPRRMKTSLLALVIPLIVCLAAWTNPLHNLYGTNFHLVQGNSITTLEWNFGLFYWIGFAYAYAVFAAGLVILLYNTLKRLRLFFWQSILLIIGALLPVALNTSFVSGLISGFELDLAPFSFLITGVIWSLTIFFFHFLTIVPIAHQNAFKQMPVGMVVLDHLRQAVDINPAAASMLGVSMMKMIGQELPKDIAVELFGAPSEPVEGESKRIIHLRHEADQRYLEVNQTPFGDRRQQFIGTLLLLYDITERIRAEQVQL